MGISFAAQIHAAEWRWVVPPGGTLPEPTLFYGDVLRRYRYDGFGRLIRTESPPTSGNVANGFYTEDFYYDGVRRIQERVTDPESSGVVDQLRREYVWGPGDEGFDELLVQHDGHEWATRNIGWWSLFDTAGNMVALCDLVANGTARVAAQWAYEPYGDAIAAEHIHDFPVQTLGHKGLFLDRLDNPTNAPASLGSGPAHRLVPFAHSIYHNRNRVYAPSLGKFLQQDPNQTAMALLEGSYHGTTVGAGNFGFNLNDLYTDGHNLFAYNRSNPIANSDPTGLVVAIEAGLVLRDIAEAMVTQYARNMVFDAHWATDWGSSDNASTRESSDWVLLSIAQAAYDNGMSYATGGLSDIADLVESGIEGLRELMAGSRLDLVTPTKSAMKHGGALHRRLLLRQISDGLGLSIPFAKMRVNRTLIDPRNGNSISKMRPDFFGVDSKGTIYIGESAVTQSVKSAEDKLKKMESLLTKKGLRVKRLPVMTPDRLLETDF